MSSRQPIGSQLGSTYQGNSLTSESAPNSLRRLSRLSAYVTPLTFAGADLTAVLLAWFIGRVIAHSDADLSLWATIRQISATPLSSWHFSEIALILAIFGMSVGTRGHYTQRIPTWTELHEVVKAGLFAAFCDYLLLAGMPGTPLTVSFVVKWTMFVPLVLAGRQLGRAGLRAARCWTVRTVFVGDTSAAQRVARALESDASLGYHVVGVIPFGFIQDHASPAELHTVLESHQADFLAIATGLDQQEEANIIAVLEQAHIPFALVPTSGLPLLYGRAHYFFSHDVAMFTNRQGLPKPVSRRVKIVFDFMLAVTLIIVIAPVLLVIAAAIRLEGGPALFRHNRIGENGRVFGCMKFRTMKTDGDRVLAALLATDPAAAAEWSATRKLREDPRITRVGHVLRKTSLDELPQLFNILRGEMSFVGPRPIVQSETAFYGKDMDYYYRARPGLTGLWQVTGRSNTSYARRVELDVWYVKNWTLWHDIAILVKTIPAVLLREGAR